MGNALRTAAEWTEGDQASDRKLEYTPLNELILTKIMEFISGFSHEYPDESKMTFEQPLKWNTLMIPCDFTDGFVGRCGGDVVSQELNDQREPFLVFRHNLGRPNQLFVSSFKYLSIVLALAGDRALAEARSCVEANPSPLRNILGDRYTSRESLNTSKVVEELLLHIDFHKNCCDEEEANRTEEILKMYLLLVQLDELILLETVKQMTVESKLIPNDVEQAYQLLQHLVAADENKSAIEYVSWMQPFTTVSANGCRAPVDRQLLGDIAYLNIQLTGFDMICVTASEYGYFVIHGQSYGSMDIDFSRRGPVRRDIITLLRNISPAFRHLVDQHGGPDRSALYDASAPFDANAVPEPSPCEVGELPVTPGYEYELAPDVPAEPERLEAVVEDAEQYERVYEEGEMICTCVPAPAPPPGSVVVHYYGPVSFERERFPYDDFGQPYELPEEVHYYGPVSFERERYPYSDFGYAFDPHAAGKEEVVEEEAKVSPRGAVSAHEPEKEDDTALIAAIMEEPSEDRTQYMRCGAEMPPSTGVKRRKKRRMSKPGRLSQRRATPHPKALDAARRRKKSAPLHTTRKMPSSLLRQSNMDQWLGESSSDDDFVDSDTEDERRRADHAATDTDHWLIQKLIRYIKSGDQAATIIALCSLQDMNLYNDQCQLSIIDAGGLEVLINLLESGNTKGMVGALKILREMCTSKRVCVTLKQFGGIASLIELLQDTDRQVQGLAAEVISQLSHLSAARRMLRVKSGIKRLVALLDIPSSHMDLLRQTAPPKAVPVVPSRRPAAAQWPGELPADVEATAPRRWRQDVQAARSAAQALYTCSGSKRNRLMMRKEGTIPLLARLIQSDKAQLLVPIVGILNNFAKEHVYRVSILSENMVYDLVRTLKIEHVELEKNAASAVFQCAEDPSIRELIRRYGGLNPLVNIVNNPEVNPEVLLAATGAIWKLSLSEDNVAAFQRLGIIPVLVRLLSDQPEKVVTYVAGALTELTRIPENRELFYTSGGVQALLKYQMSTEAQLIVNVNNAIANCALHPPSLAVIDSLEGLCSLWSVLKHPNPEAQASAAWAICPCVENIKDSAELVRSLVGGLELLVNQLKSDHLQVLASACAAIATVARGDEENLAVMTDQGVVALLSRLTCTTNAMLRHHVAEAISVCCWYDNNRMLFGKEGVIAAIVGFLRTRDPDVHRTTARALHELSRSPDNCITMHRAGAIRKLLPLVGDGDSVMQEAAAGCISNIRRLALANQKTKKSRKSI